MKEVLKVIDLKKSYGKNEVLKGVNFSINENEIKVIIGPSGGGKSTLLYCINFLVKPNSGKIFLDGVELTSSSVDLPKMREKIGFVFQHFNLFMHLDAYNNVLMGLVRVKKMRLNEAKETAENSLNLVGIDKKLWNLYPAQLSGGQQQRVAIARAIAMDPRIILFDEPTSALDVELIGEVLKAIKNLALKGMTMLLVTHEIEFAKDIANEILFLDNGVIIDKGIPEEMIMNPKNERIKKFLGIITKEKENV
ncbi:MAG TPA: amino acid ABC transporter ATP-binding protein [Caldisericia bacterium]|nr:amino acid ABC transporter ATP-binding protein [Caldisericia bacterium]HPB33289.1 amino acid ABC transporter ATP-binding protein [Caldisericia bacterium]HQL66464.1 amino acid ABC transporter ATP-binding protein [Caldisericia bacterium]HQN48211.1 amino acid ABC transporter ATP-binding protein [Caldisericia bacterium]HQO99250.1 amino acid ABC transporter ATP-binding protein [Caldisericia bacterium]